MATAFRPKGGRIRGRLDAEELSVVVQMLRSVREFVAPEQEDTGDPLLDLVAGLDHGDTGLRAPQDPALLRLLPVAHRSDDAQAQEFRELTEHSLRRRKSANLDVAIETLTDQGPGTIELDEQQAGAVMIGLTDVRLVLGERLDLRTDEDSAAMHEEVLAATSPTSAHDATEKVGRVESGQAEQHRLQQMALYDFLTWLQESLASSLLEQ